MVRVTVKRLNLLDVIAELAVGIAAGGAAAGPVHRAPVSEQVPDEQDGAGNGDLSLGLAAAAGDPGVALAEEGGVRAALTAAWPEGAAQPGVALALPRGPGPGPGLAGVRAQPGP